MNITINKKNMKAKVWNYSGWINETSPDKLRYDFKMRLKNCHFEIVGFTEHFFEPMGYTCIWLLGESHFAIHTFPEENKSYIELSSCNEVKHNAFIAMLKDGNK